MPTTEVTDLPGCRGKCHHSLALARWHLLHRGLSSSLYLPATVCVSLQEMAKGIPRPDPPHDQGPHHSGKEWQLREGSRAGSPVEVRGDRSEECFLRDGTCISFRSAFCCHYKGGYNLFLCPRALGPASTSRQHLSQAVPICPNSFE